MKITGFRRWLVLVLVSLFSGTMVVTPYLRFNYYDQMRIVFTQYRPIVDADVVNTFIGNMALVEGAVVIIFYIVGGLLADRLGERLTITLGGLFMAIGSFWYALLTDATSILLTNVLFGVGTGLLFCAYLKIVRKLGTESEQSRMYSTSEFVRGIIGTLLGFLGVGLLDAAVMNGVTDTQLVGQQFSTLLYIHTAIYLVLTVIMWFMIPKNFIGQEESDSEEQEPVSIKGLVEVLKMPGVWLVALVIFFCYSVTACGSGYLNAFMTDVLQVSSTSASTFAIIRNYIIAALSTLAIGFVAAKVGSEVKTLGFYLLITAALIAVMIFTQGAAGICVVITFLFAISYTGMRGIYFAQTSEVKIPVRLNGIATGVISVICYLPDVYFATLAGSWLDAYGNAAYNMIWVWAIACCALGIVMVFITRRYIKKINAK